MAKTSPNEQIEDFFTIFVFGFIATDIRREIHLARSGKTAGNFLCALGLLCYTELLGGVKRGTLAPGQGRANFEAFFADLGDDYRQLVDADGESVYEVSPMRDGSRVPDQETGSDLDAGWRFVSARRRSNC